MNASRSFLRPVIAAGLVLAALAGCPGRGPTPAEGPMPLADADLALAKSAWTFLTSERQPSGLVSSASRFPAISMWDAGSQLAGMCAGLELGFIDQAGFDAWMGQALGALARLPLYEGELPNKVYHAGSLIPLGYGDVTKRREIGWSALDLGRLVRWLDLVATRHPRHAAACKAVTDRWKPARLARDGAMMGTDARAGAEAYNQEGRLGYEQYAAYGLAKLGLKVDAAADRQRHHREAQVSGVAVPADRREDPGAHNYVTSEPYVLDGLESGFQALPAAWAGAVLRAQEVRAGETGKPTIWSEDNVDRAPYFVYSCLYVNGRAWAAVDADGEPADAHRGSSLKAAAGWHVLYRTPFTRRAYEDLRGLHDPARGAFAGRYEADGEPNRALTLNTNGVVLEAMLVAKAGKPLEAWAREAAR